MTAVVACNIYITSASSPVLTRLLSRTQEHCRRLRIQNNTQQRQQQQCVSRCNNAVAAIIHANADIPYDRSSFHLAGRSDCVAEVAIRLIQTAINEMELESDISGRTDKSETRHPFVGLVDHVAIMPLTGKEASTTSTTMHAARVAREIGSAIVQSSNINIHYYGLASPNQTPLATVRRKTSFFNSGGASSIGAGNVKVNQSHSDCIIGVPVHFVENYNIRLTPNVDFSAAKTLTQALRGRNIPTKGMGVPGVEALTLPYNRDVTLGGNVFEVACNLTQPKTGSVEKIEEELEKWIQQQKKQLHSIDDKDDNCQYNRDYFVEKAYRVGTTEEQCQTVLKDAIDDDEYWMQYDEQVCRRFKEFLGHR